MKVHFIGIGGIGVSALARYYLLKGHRVSGSDLTFSEISGGLKKIGAKIFIGRHKSQNISTNPGLIVYSPAVTKDNPELKEAKKRGIKCQSYPEALGELTKEYFTIAVCGSHGKSTVVAMLGIILTKAGFDPTVIVGTKLKEFGDSNCRVGKGEYLVIEADEHFASFLNYWPRIIVLTNLEPDHLDYYKNFKNYTLAFKKFVSHLPADGILITSKDNKVIRLTFPTSAGNVRFYSLKDKESAKIKRILKVPGEFNISNALAALTAARALKIPDKVSFKALSEYKGSWRRFEEKSLKIGERKFKIINDYAHHPSQIEATLSAARNKFRRNKIWCVYQPHQYQRTHYLFDDFVNVFATAPIDKIIITDIYDVPGREGKGIKSKVSSRRLVDKIKERKFWLGSRGGGQAKSRNSVMHISTLKKTAEYLKKNLQGGEVLIIMGAGDIYSLSSCLFKIPAQVRNL